MKEVKFAYAGNGLSTYIVDDGSWDGTREDAGRFPQVDLPYEEDDTVAAAAEEFRGRGLLP